MRSFVENDRKDRWMQLRCLPTYLAAPAFAFDVRPIDRSRLTATDLARTCGHAEEQRGPINAARRDEVLPGKSSEDGGRAGSDGRSPSRTAGDNAANRAAVCVRRLAQAVMPSVDVSALRLVNRSAFQETLLRLGWDGDLDGSARRTHVQGDESRSAVGGQLQG
jgi:hypothetical protein